MPEENEILLRQVGIRQGDWDRAKALAKTAENEPGRSGLLRGIIRRGLDIEEAKQKA